MIDNKGNKINSFVGKSLTKRHALDEISFEYLSE